MTSDPSASSIANAANWLQATLLGPVATTIAIMAVAAVGFLMLSGRLHWRRGAWTVVGCFMLFGAPSIAAGLIGAARSGDTGFVQAEAVEPMVPPAAQAAERPQSVCWTCGTEPAASSDPYAGASVTRR